MPKWKIDSKTDRDGLVDAWYEFNGHNIPVFNVVHPELSNLVLVVDKSNVGKLIQYSPFERGEVRTESGIFKFKIQAYSENPNLIDDLMKQPPEWLSQKGNNITQKEYLEERIWIQIFEKYEHKEFSHEKKLGYKLVLDRK